jgi:N-acetylneuraminate lyase
MTLHIRGLVAPPHTPMQADGSVKLESIEAQAELFAANGIGAVFLCGATGEFASLSFDERAAITDRWLATVQGSELTVIVQVGGNRIREGRVLARRAAHAGAHAIAALAPSYFKPRTVAELVSVCAEQAAGAPELPFFFYDIPALSGVDLPMDEFLVQARERIPAFAGIKFSRPDLVQLQKCLALAADELDILYGQDETLLAALELGVRGAVGSTYNFAPGLYQRMKRALDAGDSSTARREQLRAIALVDLLGGYGYVGASKAVMGFLGVDCGPARAPLPEFDGARRAELRLALEELGFFDWCRDDPESKPEW